MANEVKDKKDVSAETFAGTPVGIYAKLFGQIRKLMLGKSMGSTGSIPKLNNHVVCTKINPSVPFNSYFRPRKA